MAQSQKDWRRGGRLKSVLIHLLGKKLNTPMMELNSIRSRRSLIIITFIMVTPLDGIALDGAWLSALILQFVNDL